MEWAVTPDELKPVTIDDVISPVPMNPSCMSVSCRFKAVARTDLERSSKRPEYICSILSDDGRGAGFASCRQTLPWDYFPLARYSGGTR
jgi:hypothetical protein